jgi:O-antigen/teichoic acid export membrane protein
VSILSNSRFYFYGLITAVINIIIAVYLNFLLIPLYGINGAAFATMVTISVNIITSVVMVYIKFGFLPTSKGQLYSMFYLVSVLLLFLITNGISNIWIKSAVDISLVISIGYVAIRYFKVSTEMETLLVNILNRFNTKVEKFNP